MVPFMTGPTTTPESGDRVGRVVDAAREAATALADADREPHTDNHAHPHADPHAHHHNHRRLLDAVESVLTDPETMIRLARISVTETGRSHPDARFEKVSRAVDGAFTDVRGPLRGPPVERGGQDDGQRDWGRVVEPVGVVGATVPATHPVVVPAVLSLFALRTRNAVVFAPTPSTVETCDVVVTTIRRALADAGAPPNLVGMLPAPPRKPATDALFEQVNLACAAGSAATVEAARRCGTPSLATRADGAVAVVDASADPRSAASGVAAGAAYDFGAHPASDAAVVVTESAADAFRDGLEAAGGYVLSAAEREQLDVVLTEAGETNAMVPSDDLRGCSPRRLASAAVDGRPSEPPAFLVAEASSVDEPTARLPGIPAVTVHERAGFSAALDAASQLGAGHVAAVHTEDSYRVERAATALGVGRLVTNQPAVAAAGGREEGLPVAPLLGAGSAEGSHLDGGLTHEAFCNGTTVARRPSARTAGRGQTGFGGRGQPADDS